MTALDFVQALLDGTAESWRARMTPQLQAAFPPGRLAQVARGMARFGEPGRIVVRGQSASSVHRNVELGVQFPQLPWSFTVRLAPDGRVDDYYAAPVTFAVPAGPPPYADPTAFTEREVVIGEGEWALPGTLSVPAGPGPFPVVVLVHGSGPQNRDVTILGVQVFRDLAQGLATRGIAVLRFEKRTCEHTQKLAPLAQMTLREESVLDVAGLILVAAPNDFYAALLEQNKLAVQNREAPPEQVPFITAQIAMVSDPAFIPSSPPAGFALGMPHYWADLRGLTADLLQGTAIPLLILQGARDFQVPAAQLESWQAALGDRPGVTYKLYERLNHVLTEGEGPMSSTAEYARPANVAPYVVEDIAAWIAGRGRGG